jgi:hypothetical protein
MATPHGANIVANDEIIAKMLQEELENVTAAEASEAAGAVLAWCINFIPIVGVLWECIQHVQYSSW